MSKNKRHNYYNNEQETLPLAETASELPELEVVEDEPVETEEPTVLEYGPKPEEEIVEVPAKNKKKEHENINKVALMAKILNTYSATISKIVRKYMYYEIVSIEEHSLRLYEIKFKVNSEVTFSVVFEPIHGDYSLQKIKVI